MWQATISTRTPFATRRLVRLKCQLALICALAASRFTVMLRALAEVNRLFLVRLRWFLSTICNPDKPTPLFGQVLYYISRIEFQSRGSPHAHIVIWIADRATVERINAEITAHKPPRFVENPEHSRRALAHNRI